MVNPCGFFNVIVPAPNPYFLCNPLNVKSPSEPHSNHGCLQQAPSFLLISPAYPLSTSCSSQRHAWFSLTYALWKPPAIQTFFKRISNSNISPRSLSLSSSSILQK
ncbi:hypothetical protein ATANTOWER_022085 [Ataeniobius toweri]|uniref:Uncharacterized protein n=1 Tax=Ataeniobius toweri TaxID=208326 RepID=A0ABU7B7Z3_9TELE|nr:hypothetical protein [Ataeniobius toweri]